MAIRYDAAADRILRTTDLLNYNNNYTVMAWVYPTTITSALVFALNTNNSASDLNEDIMYISSVGGTLRLYCDIAGTFQNPSGSTLSATTWNHLALVRSSSSVLKGYLNGVDDLTASTNITGRTAVTRFESGAYTTSNTIPLNGRVAYIKAWSTNLTANEILQEMGAIRPITNLDTLYGWWPTLPGTTERLADYSGNGRVWTEGGTLTDEDPPPVSWGARSLYPQPVIAAAAGGWGKLLSNSRNRLVV